MATKQFLAKNGLNNNYQTIQNVADPVNAQDAATRAYVLANAGSATATYTRSSFTASVGQTVFNAVYTPSYIQVYVNGTLLNAADYTASNGTSVTLAIGATLNDIVETIAHAVSVAGGPSSNLSGGSLGTIPYQSGIGTTAMLAVGTAGQALVSNNSAAPVWTTLTLENLPDAWVKKACQAATTVALTINTAQVTIDGVTLSATSRVLVKDQATQSQNGIYTGVTTTTWVRSTDANTADKLAGAAINVDGGTVNGGKVFDTDFKVTDVLGTTAVAFYSFVDTSTLLGSPLVTALRVNAGGTAVGTAPLKITPSASVLTTPEAGAFEVDSTNTLAYFTGNTTSGRGLIPTCQFFKLAANLAVTTTTIAPFFGTASSIPLVASGHYEIEFFCVFLKNTAGTATWTFTNSAVVTNMVIQSEMSAITGSALTGIWAAPLTGVIATQTIAAVALPATGSLTTAVNHFVKFKVILENASSTSLRLNITQSAGTVTPLRGSYWKATRIANVGILAT